MDQWGKYAHTFATYALSGIDHVTMFTDKNDDDAGK